MATIGVDLTTGEPVEIEDASRPQGVYVIGKPGMGKSTLLERMVLADLEAGHGLALFDPQGDLTDKILGKMPSNRIPDVVVLDAGDEQFLFGLNLFESNDGSAAGRARAADSVAQAFKKVWAVGDDRSWGPRLENLLRNTAAAFIEHGGLTLVEVQEFLLAGREGKRFRQRLLTQVTHPAVRTFWQRFEQMTDREQREHSDPVLNKVEQLLNNPLMYAIFGQVDSTIDFRELMDDQRVLIVRLELAQIGDEAVSLLGSVMIGRLLEAALSRRDTQYRPAFHLFADEYQRFATPAFGILIEEARKYQVGITVAHQRREQLELGLRESPLATANVVVFGVTPRDGEDLAGLFKLEPKQGKVVGQRERLSISNDPIGHLLKQAYEDEAVEMWVDDYLKPLEQWIVSSQHNQVLTKAFHAAGAPYRYSYDFRRTQLEQGMAMLQLYVADVVAGKIESFSEDDYLRAGEIAVALRGFLKIHEHMYISEYASEHPEFDEEIPFPDGLWRAVRRFARCRSEEDDEDEGEEEESAVSPCMKLLLEGWWTWSVKKHGRKQLEEQQAAFWYHEARRLARFVDLTTIAASTLEIHPIMEGAGIFDDIYEERSYADLRGEMANELSVLDPYLAWCRVRRGDSFAQHKIRISTDDHPTTYQVFTPDGSPLTDVLTEILARRERLLAPEPPEAIRMEPPPPLPVRKRGERGV